MTRRWLAPVVVVVTAGVLFGAMQLPSKTVQPLPVSVVGNRTVVCPAADAGIAATTIWASAAGSISARQIGLAAPVTIPAEGFKPTSPVAVTADQTVGAISTSTTGGAIWLAACTAPGVDAAFPGIVSDTTRRASVVLTNTDPTQASVDITLLGRDGRINAPGSRGITVLGGSSRIVALSTLVTSGDPVTAVVAASEGRVHAVVRMEGAGGSDWQTAGASASTEQVLAGVPGGDGPRVLVIANPGTRRASVAVQVLGKDSAFAPAGAESIDVGPESTVAVPIQAALNGETVGVKVTSAQAIVAAIRASTAATGGDLAVVGARPALNGVTRVPVVPGSTIVASNPGDADETLSVTVRNTTGDVTDRQQLVVGAGRTATLPVGGAAGSVELSTDGPNTRVSVVATSLSGTQGLGVATLGPGGGVGTTVVPKVDPGLGG